jgi:hypothetical protein
MTRVDPAYNDDMLTVATRPLKRLTRPADPPGFLMTRRHVLIMEALAQYRNLDANQIARLVGGSPRGVGSNLRSLFWHGYVDRPQGQHVTLAAFFDEGNRPLVYALTRKGARFLTDRGHALEHRLDWTFRRVTPLFLAHTVEVAEVMMQFGFACRDCGNVRLIDHHELLPQMPESTRARRDPFKLLVTIHHDRKPLDLAVVPDRLFTLLSAGSRPSSYALELDRGSMDINAKRLVGKSSFRRKQIGYFNARKQKKHTELWGFDSFRCLTVTTSDARIAKMIKAEREVTGDSASGFFLYTTRERLAAHGPFAPVWISSKADGISLLRSTHNTMETKDAR